MSTTILLINIVALATLAACISWVYRYYLYTDTFSLVLDKLPQLVETPVGQSCSLWLSGRNPFTNILEVFKSYCASGAFSLVHDLLRDTVVLIGLEVSLLPCDLFKFATGRNSTLLLKICPTINVFTAYLLNLLTSMCIGIRVSSNVDYTEVDTYYIIGNTKRWLFNFTHRVKVEVTCTINQIYFAFAKWKKLSLIVSADKSYGLSTFHCPDVNHIAFREADNSIVIGNAAMFLESTFSLFIHLVGISDFSDATNNHLSSKLVGIFNRVVNQFMQIKLLESLSVPSLLTNIVASLISPLKRRAENLRLFTSWLQLEINDQFHGTQYATNYQVWKARSLRQVAAFSSAA